MNKYYVIWSSYDGHYIEELETESEMLACLEKIEETKKKAQNEAGVDAVIFGNKLTDLPNK